MIKFPTYPRMLEVHACMHVGTKRMQEVRIPKRHLATHYLFKCLQILHQIPW